MGGLKPPQPLPLRGPCSFTFSRNQIQLCQNMIIQVFHLLKFSFTYVVRDDFHWDDSSMRYWIVIHSLRIAYLWCRPFTQNPITELVTLKKKLRKRFAFISSVVWHQSNTQHCVTPNLVKTINHYLILFQCAYYKYFAISFRNFKVAKEAHGSFVRNPCISAQLHNSSISLGRFYSLSVLLTVRYICTVSIRIEIVMFKHDAKSVEIDVEISKELFCRDFKAKC